ncbi:MAG: type I restriction endonuclease subunit R [Acidimicrobiia bacterium]|nr:type I restriction endonuclease subunit R [Acidimicrobiia bacterium]MYB79544.1 type I restriction endonuclease subunit R [Acidimicrobiia bacterium]MYD40845.1 type I restriction endonuclease subunit R [Acidimicrobiia bacterium]
MLNTATPSECFVDSGSPSSSESSDAMVTESLVEDAAIDWFVALGYRYTAGPEMVPGPLSWGRKSYEDVVLESVLQDSIERLNPKLQPGARLEAFRKITRPEGATTVARNRDFHRKLVNGVNVETQSASGAIRGAQARIIDFTDPSNNYWMVVNQFTVSENGHNRRPDLVVFVNGLPLGIIELKSPGSLDATVWSAWQQLQTYQVQTRRSGGGLPGLCPRT